MTTRTGTSPLRLPLSVKAAVEQISARDGTSMNQSQLVAAAEKVSAARNARADRTAFRRILNRRGGERPRADDKIAP
jgi:hypothetical protein